MKLVIISHKELHEIEPKYFKTIIDLLDVPKIFLKFKFSFYNIVQTIEYRQYIGTL